MIATNIATITLSDADLQAVLAARQAAAQGNAVVVLEPTQPQTFADRMLALNGTNLNRWSGVRPAAIVTTAKGRRGVFWAGYKNGVFRIGTCKITDGGLCYKPNRFDGCWFDSLEKLAEFNA